MIFYYRLSRTNLLLVLLVFVAVGFFHLIHLKELGCARVSLPVEIVFGLAGASEIEPALFTRGAVCERDVVVGDIIKEVDFFLLQE
jgi:hypothetical protein